LTSFFYGNKKYTNGIADAGCTIDQFEEAIMPGIMIEQRPIKYIYEQVEKTD